MNHPGKIFCLAALGASLVAGCGGDKNTPPPANAQNNAAQPGQPGQPGYQPQPGAQPGYQPQPGYQQQPGYQPQPGAQPGYQPQPGPQPGYQPQPGPQPGYQPQPGPQPGAQNPPQNPGQPGGQYPQMPGMPGAPPAAGGGGGGTAQALDPNVAMVATTALATIANTQAPGMAREGNTLAGNFTPGQTLSQPFTIAPGKCYTIIAAGVGPGMQVDITAQASGPVAIPGFNPQFGSAQGKPSPTGSQAVLGGGNNCIKLALSPVPIQATYVITVSKGSGMVAAQLYSK